MMYLAREGGGDVKIEDVIAIAQAAGRVIMGVYKTEPEVCNTYKYSIVYNSTYCLYQQSRYYISACRNQELQAKCGATAVVVAELILMSMPA